MSDFNDMVRGFISDKHGDSYDFRPQEKQVGDKSVYEVNIAQKIKDDEGESWHNVRVSVWGRAIPPVKAVVEKILATPKEKRPQIAFEGQWQQAYTSPKGTITLQFRGFDASPWFSAYRDR